MAGPRQYLFQPSEHGLQVELYLPKRADFQGLLYDTLTEAFDAGKIRAYLADPHNRSHLAALLGRNWPGLVARLDSIARRLETGIKGYSLYEVDGVYAGDEGVVSERTQVVRLMFLPDLDGMAGRAGLAPERARDETKILLRDYGADSGFYREKKGAGVEPAVLALCEALEGWVEEVGLVLYGFIVNRVCLAIRDRDLRPEEEIRVTSSWGFTVNALRFEGAPEGKP